MPTLTTSQKALIKHFQAAYKEAMAPGSPHRIMAALAPERDGHYLLADWIAMYRVPALMRKHLPWLDKLDPQGDVPPYGVTIKYTMGQATAYPADLMNLARRWTQLTGLTRLADLHTRLALSRAIIEIGEVDVRVLVHPDAPQRVLVRRHHLGLIGVDYADLSQTFAFYQVVERAAAQPAIVVRADEDAPRDLPVAVIMPFVPGWGGTGYWPSETERQPWPSEDTPTPTAGTPAPTTRITEGVAVIPA